jgi:lysozyme
MTAIPSVRGPDVSNHQRLVDWQAVAVSGMAFAFCKASEGTYYRDPYFAGNWAGIKAAGLKRGAYQFARPSSGSPDAEAALFLDQVDRAGGAQPGDMLVLDLEDEQYRGGGPYGSAGAWALGFCEYLEAATGFLPIVYWATWYRPADIAALPALSRYPLWLASYRATMPPAPAPWQRIAFWQYTSSGRVPGVNGDCDVNLFNGPAEHLALYGKPSSESVPSDDQAELIAAYEMALKTLRDETLPAAIRDAESSLAALREAQRICRQMVGER